MAGRLPGALSRPEPAPAAWRTDERMSGGPGSWCCCRRLRFGCPPHLCPALQPVLQSCASGASLLPPHLTLPLPPSVQRWTWPRSVRCTPACSSTAPASSASRTAGSWRRSTRTCWRRRGTAVGCCRRRQTSCGACRSSGSLGPLCKLCAVPALVVGRKSLDLTPGALARRMPGWDELPPGPAVVPILVSS